MKKLDYKGRCEKRISPKSNEVCRTYNAIQRSYLDVLDVNEEIIEIHCNVPLIGFKDARNTNKEYSSDFMCKKSNGELMVRECVYRKYLEKPLTVELLDGSMEYWKKHGVKDWGIVIDE